MNLPHLSTLPEWSDYARIALDIETRDSDLTTLGPGVRRSGGFITGIAFACDDRTNHGPAFYLPIAHAGGGNYDNPAAVLAYFRHQAKHFRGEIVGANLQYDLDWLAEAGIEFQPRFFRDVQVSGPLLDVPDISGVPNLMSLNEQAKRAGLPGKDDSELAAWAAEHGLDLKKDMWKAPAARVAKYAVQDVRLPLQLLRRHERDIDDQELWRVYDLESRLLPVLVKMRRRGVRVDLSKLETIQERAQELEVRAMRQVSALSGVQVTCEDTNRSAALARCFENVGQSVPFTVAKDPKPSIKAAWLAGLGTDLAKAILDARKWNKVRTTFCKSIREHTVNGRIHCTFNQLRQERETGETKGAAFGRLSSSDPNLQQQPARDPEIGPLWRSIYLPDDGGEWACLDFSSQEPRLITHYAELVGCQGGREAAEACRRDPDWDNHSMMASMMYDDFDAAALKEYDADGRPTKRHKRMKLLRGNAKTIFLGLCYGMGGGKLCKSLGLPTKSVVRDPNAQTWTIYEVDSIKGRELQKRGAKPFEMAAEEGQALLDRFNSRVPYVKQLQRMVQNKAQKEGFIKTLLGRRCRFPRHPQTGRIDWAHKGLNRLIQGGSADQTKEAMVLADAAGVRLQLQVHDELDLTVWDRKEAEQLREIMEHAVELQVPTRCDIEIGPDWGHIA